MRITIVMLSMLVAVTGVRLAAEDAGADPDVDSLFESGEVVDDRDAEGADEGSQGGSKKAEDDLLVSEGIEWGGNFICSFSFRSSYADIPGVDAFFTDGNLALETELRADLFFDSRPANDFRVFGKLKAYYPFDIAYDTDPDADLDPIVYVPDIRIFELFSDFSYEDIVYFRVGKHTIKWGVGYFYSPADVLNLAPIDLTDPLADREGPVSLRTQVPFFSNNAYLYLIANDIDTPEKIAVAPKVEFVIGPVETGIGCFYRSDLAPRGIVTMTGGLGDVDLFGEAVLAYGSDKRFIRESSGSGTYEMYTRNDELFFSGTCGASYLHTDPDFMFYAQYYFNGEGYDDSSLYPTALIDLASSEPTLSLSDVACFGMHYLACSAVWSEIADSNFSATVLSVNNLSDLSGYLNLSISYKFFDHATATLGAIVCIGDETDEMVLGMGMGKRLAAYLTFYLGNGRF